MGHFLGIDVGSSAVKVALFDTEGTSLAESSHSYATTEPRPGWKEQNPEDWWKAVEECSRKVLAAAPAASLLGIGVTGHISSLTFLSADGRPVRPSMGFQDRRALAETAELYRVLSREELATALGIDLPPSPTWTLPRLLWLKKNEPGALNAARTLLQAKDYINFKLTGNLASDPSSNRGIVNFHEDSPAFSVFARLGLPNLLPPLHAPQQAIGYVTAEAAAETGIPQGIPVAAGWNDLNACVLGAGLVEPGQCFNVTGTSEHIGAVTTGTSSPPELICAPYLPGRKLLYGVTSCGGGSLEWLSQLTGRTVEELLGSPYLPGGELLFLPYLNGERSPIWDSNASGVFLGLRTAHGLGDLAQAIMEGVAFSLRQNLEIVEQYAPFKIEAVMVSGGASRGARWNQIKADVMGKRIVRQSSAHAGILGAAILASVAAGIYPTIESAARSMTRSAAAFEPRAELRRRVDRMYRIYRKGYPALREIFSELNGEMDSIQGDDSNER